MAIHWKLSRIDYGTEFCSVEMQTNPESTSDELEEATVSFSIPTAQARLMTLAELEAEAFRRWAEIKTSL